MAIQKFIVNGDEAKIDYEGLENKPFGEPINDTVYPLKTSTYTDPYEDIPEVELDYSDFESSIVVGEHYIVKFDGIEYEVEAYARSGYVTLSNINMDVYPAGFVFMVQYTDDPEDTSTAYASTIGDHSLSITRAEITTLNPSYLPKDLQFIKLRAPDLLPEQEVVFTSGESSSIPIPWGSVPEDSLQVLYVTYDGVEYECYRQVEWSEPYRAFWGNRNNTYSSYPFRIVQTSGSTAGIWNADSGTTSTHTIKFSVQYYGTLKGKYFPNVFLSYVDPETGDSSIEELPFLDGIYQAITNNENLSGIYFHDPRA